ncbi:MAG: 3-phosphoshikimate 1-carboxyvinyltransferase [Firmicutes bacterium ZCTH02-B6]|nr:MAG: 3-phosphoshikimate 1-carboxyvinyltransferase [Firmicutes bacterium ZCTH02-B6]
MSRSPWAWQPPGATVVVGPPPGPLDADMAVPGSKSVTNRALIMAALAKGVSRLEGILRSDDSYWCVQALQGLGIDITVNGTAVHVSGCGGRWPNKTARLYLGSAGTLARFLPGALAAGDDGQWELDGSAQLRGRPISPLVAALRALGAEIGYLDGDGQLPIRVRAGLSGGHVAISGRVSSQFTSGLLLAAPYARRPVEVTVVDELVQPEYVGLTIEMMRAFGAHVEAAGLERIHVQPRPYTARTLMLEADASTACYFLTAAALSGGRVRITNVGYRSLQPDARFVDVLERMGCRVARGASYLEVVGPTRLVGGFTVDMRPMSDQALTLGAAAVFADAPITVTGVPHIRRHESDRIAVFVSQMGRLGIRVDEHPDGFTVHPGVPRPAATLDPHDDHRQAMAFSLLGVRVPGIRIADPGCVSKTCPAYFDFLARLGLSVAYR